MNRFDYSKEMPVPPEAYTNTPEKKVFFRMAGENGRIRNEKIGKLIEGKKNMMNPTYSFILKNPDYVKQYYPACSMPVFEYHYGLYALVLGIVQKTGLYSILRDTYQVTAANALLDYCMFLIHHGPCTAELFEEAMREQALFSSERVDESWYSAFFESTIVEELNQEMRLQWVRKLKAAGLKSVWLVVEDSKYDDKVRKGTPAQRGHAESQGADSALPGYMVAVDAQSGRPVTYSVYEGPSPDRSAFHQMSTFLNASQIEIEGVILGRDFAAEDLLGTILSFGWKYVLLLPSESYGQQQMIREHGKTLQWRMQYRIPQTGLFGISDNRQLFWGHETTSEISLFYDGLQGSSLSVRQMRQLDDEMVRLKAEFAQGKTPVVSAEFRQFLSLDLTDHECRIVENHESLENALRANGFFAVATSGGMDPQTALHTFELRDCAKMQICILRSQEGCPAPAIPSAPGIHGRLAAAFLSGVIRAEIQLACKELQLDTDTAIQALDKIGMVRLDDEDYADLKTMAENQKQLFLKFSLSPEEVRQISADVGRRLKPGDWSQVRGLPENTEVIIRNSRIRGRRKSSTPDFSAPASETDKPRNKGGRPKGLKDSKPRKPRSDKGKPRGKRKKPDSAAL